uniref:Uncharacterized protein n=1 Tax=Anguilla anguilla TaxID=7936 RepID=A0A0E9WVC1_ANGAN
MILCLAHQTVSLKQYMDVSLYSELHNVWDKVIFFLLIWLCTSPFKIFKQTHIFIHS